MSENEREFNRRNGGGGVSEGGRKQGLFSIKDGIYLIITPLAIILSLVYWYFTVPPPGWCEKERRILSNKEVVDLAGIYTATQYQQKTIDGKVSPPLFCCYIQRKEGGFWSKMFRVDEGVSMGWWYERNEEGRGELNPKDNYYQVDWIVNSCVTKDLYRSDNTTDSLPQKSELTTNPNWVEIN